MTLVWARVDSEGGRCYVTAHHQGASICLDSHSLHLFMVKGSDTWTWERICLSVSTVVWCWDIGWGLFRCKSNTMVATAQDSLWCDCVVNAMRLLHSTWLALTSKQYLHIHPIINMIKLLQCFHININMLPVDQKARCDRQDQQKSDRSAAFGPHSINGYMWGIYL